MEATSLCAQLRIVLGALVKVRSGSSERAALAIARDQLQVGRTEFREAGRILREIVARQDQLNDFSSIIGRPLSTHESCLVNLASFLLLNRTYLPSMKTINCLRELAPRRFRREFEYYLGSLILDSPSFEAGRRSRSGGIQPPSEGSSWWLTYCIRTFGRARALRMLSESRRSRFVRLNALRSATWPKLPDQQALNSSLETVSAVPGVYRVLKPSLALSHMLVEGILQFQDLASYCAVLAADPRANERVLDICGAPGVKTAAIAQFMRNSGSIISVDSSALRLKSWEAQTTRLGVKIATPVLADATNLPMTGEQDLILLDPPCSGTGILDQNPRMKLNLNHSVIRSYSVLEARMLEEASRLVSSGGRIVYSTCSITTEENEDVVSNFLKSHPDMETKPVGLPPGLGEPGMRGLTDCRRFFPDSDESAGYFIARLEHS